MKDLVAEVESAMLKACAGSASSINPSLLAVRYHLSRPGAQLRARLCLDACARLRVCTSSAIVSATLCELLHNASLLHDDLMDRSPLRRGQKSTWNQFGDGIAICAGDLLLSAAYASIHTITPAALVPEIAALVHSRTQELICGQAQELQAATGAQTAEQYEILAIGKSASLLSLCLQLPLTLAGLGFARPLAQQVAESFAVAYQIADDLRDVEEDRLANCLNFVQILATASHLSVEEARLQARLRAEERLVNVLALARELPSACGSVLTSHAAVLQAQLRSDQSINTSVRA